MNVVIGDIVPYALGIAVSPIPIIAAILMLLSPKARTTSVGFLVGWIAGIVVAVSAFTLLASSLSGEPTSGSKPVQGGIQVVLGLLLLLVAVKQWRGRPRGDANPALPKWMQAIDKVTFPVAMGLGFLLSALNPKNLIMLAGAGIDVGSAALDTSSTVVVIALFTILAASTVAVPVIAYLVAPKKLSAPLDRLRGWLEKENAIIMAVLLLVIGVSMISKGIGNF